MNTVLMVGLKCRAEKSIAIVGMACEFPGAHSPEELWENVLAGRRFFRKAPPERLPPEYFSPDPKTPDRSCCDRMAVITGWEFDPIKFHIPPVTFRASDIAHWLALYTADAAVRNSGVDLSTVDHARAAVILGNSLTGEFNRSHYLRLRWPYVERSLRRSLTSQGIDDSAIQSILAAFRQSYEAPLPESSEDTLAGNMANTIAGRISNYFDLGGGSFTVDGACSSSLLSIVLACDALVKGDLDLALTGGVDVSLDPFEIVGFAKTKALAKEDIRPYDERAGGMLTGEGCGVFLLMRETDARSRALTIHALLKGWAYSSDGKGSITAPEVEGQCRALRRAYTTAGYPMTSVGLIEGHGTGTPLGDKVELTAIQRVLQESGADFHCVIGSIKANIGHCKAAAGAAGLIKAVQALKHMILPPTLNCDRPHPLFAQADWKLRPSTKGRIWETSSHPRRASVSGMGFGGSNGHVTLEEAIPDATPAEDQVRLLGSNQASELIALSAPDLPALQAELSRLLAVARRICLAELTDLSAALAKRPPQGACRLAFVASTPWELADSLELVRQGLRQGAELSAIHDPASGIFAGTTVENPRLIALFPGQGSQRLNMCERFRERFLFVEDFFRTERGHFCPPDGETPARQTGMSAPHLASAIFRDTLGAPGEQVKAWEKELRDTRTAQPAIVACSAVVLQVLDYLGLRPALAIGHSLGEITALHAAGYFDAPTAIHVAALRGEAMSGLSLPDPGAMLAISEPPERVEELIKKSEVRGPKAEVGHSLAISNYNSPRQTVVSGTSTAIEKLKAVCEAERVHCSLLPVSHAFHSDVVAPAADAFAKALRHLPQLSTLNPQPTARVISTATGDFLPNQPDLVKLLAGHIRQPVRFLDAVRHAANTKPHLWVEVGPGGVLTALAREILGAGQADCCATDLRSEDAMHLLNQVLARTFVLGFPVRLENFFAHRFHRPFDVQNYNPVFITNPCERMVELPPQSALQLSAVGAGLPATPFFREFMDLYERHHAHPSSGFPLSTTNLQQVRKGDTSPTAPKEEERAGTPDLLEVARGWIARRTGFPLDKVTPAKRLRDDLGLDSIKVGELVLDLSDKAGRPFSGDPAAFANSTLADMVKAVESVQPNTLVQEEARKQRLDTLGDAQSLEHWVRSFRMVLMPYPLEEEDARPLPSAGRFFIFAGSDSASARALAHVLSRRGLQIIASSASELSKLGNSPTDLVGIAVFLPAHHRAFFECPTQEFKQRVEGTAEMLFHLFRWIGHGREGDWSALRAIVVRPFTSPMDSAPDLDAGTAFLKSLRLEHLGTAPKWISLPVEWDAQRVAQTLIAELETTSGRVARHYAVDGRRFTDMALPLAGPEGQLPQLGPEDVVVVTGGAKGITAELALGLGNLTKVKLALFGSSLPPDDKAEPEENEIASNLKRFAEAGLTCAYFQCDVTNPEAVRAAVAKAERELGPITGVLHGSGISKLQSFREKSLADFLDCIRVKAAGLYHLLTCIPPTRLKMLHAVSSVLGKTGMRGQSDYTLANAWLDGAIRSVKVAFPHIHCLTLGYSVWDETGLGKKLGAADYLRSIGVRPIGTQEGVGEYLSLLQHADSGPVFVTTGNLTPDLEGNLYPPAPTFRGRFLERLRRWIPQTEICGDATLSHSSDLYLPEHVYYGTPLFPGVMAIEAMVQAANACLETTELPILRNIEFRRPLIVPEDKPVVIRTMALAVIPLKGTRRVRVVIRSDQDNFQSNYFEAECWYGLPAPPPAKLPKLPPLPEPLPLNPEDLHPVPLFQGKLFRRIQSVLRKADLQNSLTRLEIPRGEKYFADVRLPAPITRSPAVRDACLQSGAIAAPTGCLPERIAELRLADAADWPQSALCQSNVREAGPNKVEADYTLFSERGQVLEQMTGLVLGKPRSLPPAPPKPVAPIPLDRVASDLSELLPGVPHALAQVSHEELERQPELKPGDVARIKQGVSSVRVTAALGNLIATRRAAKQFAEKHKGLSVLSTQVDLHNQSDGKPQLRVSDPAIEKMFYETDVSIADCGGLSIALVGQGPVGMDIELVEARNAELWRGLLGDDGYALALLIGKETHETFDVAATRVWTLLEAGKKACGLKRILPAGGSSLGGAWLLLEGMIGDHKLEFLSTTTRSGIMVFCFAAVLSANGPDGGAGRQLLAKAPAFDQVIEEFKSEIRKLHTRCANDPARAGSEERHRDFRTVGESTAAKLFAIQTVSDRDQIKSMQEEFQQVLLGFLDGSENFRHTLTKPFGYAGDFQVLDMLAANSPCSTGLAYHFDRWQLEYPASAACRNRIGWIRSELATKISESPSRTLTILDVGIGAAPIERLLIRDCPDAHLTVLAVDIEPRALNFVATALAGGMRTVETVRLDLRDEASASRVQELARRADVCIAVGILEALNDGQAERFLRALLAGFRSGAVLYAENFVPDHPTRPFMEWFMDFHLGYRTEQALRELFTRAGASSDLVESHLEETGSLCLLKYKSPKRATMANPVQNILRSFSEGLEELQKAAAGDPDSLHCEEHYARLHAKTTGAAELLNEASKELETEDLRAVRQSMYAIVKGYLDGSQACRRCLTKPLGYPGDYLLMEQIVSGQNGGCGLAYHCDRFFLSQPGCEAIRQRSRWATGQLDSILKQANKRPVRILDLGCGPMAIENELQKAIPPGQVVELIGVDNDPDALRFAASRLNHPNARVSTCQVNLLSKAGIAEIGALVQKSDVLVSMGLIEYFSDETVLLLLSAALRAMRPGCRLLLGNYQPDHASRAVMEWFLDWWLVYRTEAQLRTLLVRAGCEQHKIHTELDATGSIVLAHAFR